MHFLCVCYRYVHIFPFSNAERKMFLFFFRLIGPPGSLNSAFPSPFSPFEDLFLHFYMSITVSFFPKPTNKNVSSISSNYHLVSMFLTHKFQSIYIHGFYFAIWLLPSAHYWNCPLVAQEWLLNQWVFLNLHLSWHFCTVFGFLSFWKLSLVFGTLLYLVSSLLQNAPPFIPLTDFSLQHSELRCSHQPWPLLCQFSVAIA